MKERYDSQEAIGRRDQASADLDDLWPLYEEYVDSLHDSYEHKRYMLSNRRCFLEWCEERPENDK